MSKKLKIYYILNLSMLALCLAFKSFSNLFGGVGAGFVLLLVCFAGISTYFFSQQNKKCLLDSYIISAVFLVLEFVMYILFEIVVSLTNVKGALIYQSVVSMLAVLCFAYVTVRFVLKLAGKTINFSFKREKKVKANKELNNGSLLDKPKKEQTLENVKDNQAENTVDLEQNLSNPMRELRASEQTINDAKPVVLEQSTYETIGRNLPKIDTDENSEK